MNTRDCNTARNSLLLFILFPILANCGGPRIAPSEDSKLLFPGETHFKNIHQLTHGGTNAEAYWSFDGKHLTFQREGARLTQDPAEPAQGASCDQIYTMRADGSGDFRFISKNLGRTTCSYFLPGDERILFASTYQHDLRCPPEPDKSKGYVWPIYPWYQIYSTRTDGSDIRPMEPGAPSVYNAEATACKDGSVVFTSDRDGDLDLYVGKLDSFGTLNGVRRITHEIGYDGGAFFSQDCRKLVWRASRPRPGKERDDYLDLLKKHLVRPMALEIWTADADGSHAHQVTRMGASSFAPYFTPDGNQILFSSNPRAPNGGMMFDLYRVNIDGTGLERVTFSDMPKSFDFFPMFSPDGGRIAFSSNRNATQPHEMNVFVADWVPGPSPVPTVDDTDPANRLFARTAQLRSLPPEKVLELIEEQFSHLGLKPQGKTFQQFPHTVQGTWGKGCGKQQHPVMIVTPLGAGAGTSASGLPALLEAARIIQAAPGSEKGCFVFSASFGSEAWSASPIRRQPKVILQIERSEGMENNALSISTGNAPAGLKNLITTECETRMLTCTLTGAGVSPGTPLLGFSTGTAQTVNATGGVQTAELVAGIALRAMAGKKSQ